MRSLSSTLLAAQKAGGQPLYKAVFTEPGLTRTYGCDTTNRILYMRHPEEEWSQQATILVDNREGNLTSDDLTGNTCTISYGYKTSAGDEYSAAAPLEVITGKQDTLLRPYVDLLKAFAAKGVFDFMAEDEASEDYAPADGNTDTIKTILTAIALATMACFSHCKSYSITFDSEDSLIDTFKTADYFRVGFKESRLEAFKKALVLTRCKARIEADGAIHVFDISANTAPHYISGTTYNYEYDDVVSGHNFFEKSVRNRLVIPNRVYVSSHPDHSPQYTGSANDSASYIALGRYMDEFHHYRVTSNAQCVLIAAAFLQTYQIGMEKGHGYAPLNCGQEVIDYIKITDSIAGDTVTGNIGYLNRICQPGKFDFEFRLGSLKFTDVSGLTDIASKAAETGYQRDPWENIDAIWNTLNYLGTHLIYLRKDIDFLKAREKVSKWHVEDQMIIPVE